MSALTFGVFFPQGWKMELASIADPQDKWSTAVDIAELAEELGYDSLWWYDHFHNVPVPAHETMFECWTTVAAISQRTSRIRLGQMVGCNGYRNPALLAKITSTVDVISGGRLDWGIGAGWYEHEFNGYGYEFPAPEGPHRHAARGGRDREGDVDRARCQLLGQALRAQGRAVRPEAAAAAPPADPHRRRRRAAHAAGRRPPRRRAPTSAASRTSSPTRPRSSRGTARRSVGTTTRSRRPGRPRCSSGRPRQRSPRPGPARSWASRWRAGRPATSSAPPSRWPRRSAGLPRPRLHGLLPLVQRLPGHRDHAPVRREGHPGVPLSTRR